MDVFLWQGGETDQDNDGLFFHFGCEPTPRRELYDCDDQDETNAAGLPRYESRDDRIDNDCDGFVDEA